VAEFGFVHTGRAVSFPGEHINGKAKLVIGLAEMGKLLLSEQIGENGRCFAALLARFARSLSF
jgi:hypothetical protein